ncbi:hypothetical protein XENORESO_012735 [Xenotaenia resolanae]|uniref:Uncharacterized protein n=1 Tax=Xenotaenia resolanae TaxID=208358 RepID=A0ABV0WM59_9TELE
MTTCPSPQLVSDILSLLPEFWCGSEHGHRCIQCGAPMKALIAAPSNVATRPASGPRTACTQTQEASYRASVPPVHVPLVRQVVCVYVCGLLCTVTKSIVFFLFKHSAG